MTIKKMVEIVQEKTPEEMKELMLLHFSAMTPKEYSDHLNNEHKLAFNHGREKERVEIVCRFLASGIEVDEIAAILGAKKNEIDAIRNNHATTTIPEYVKKLKARRRRV